MAAGDGGADSLATMALPTTTAVAAAPTKMASGAYRRTLTPCPLLLTGRRVSPRRGHLADDNQSGVGPGFGTLGNVLLVGCNHAALASNAAGATLPRVE